MMPRSTISAARGHHDLGNARDEISTLELHFLALALGRCGSDRHLGLLSRALANQHIVLALDVVDDRLVHLVAAGANGTGGDDSGQ